MSDALKQSLKDQEDRKREMMRLALLDEFNKGMKEGLSQNKIDSNLSSLKRILENQYGIPFSMATGGSVQGIGSLSDTARDMFRGPRGIGAYQQFAEGGAATARDKVEIESLRNAVMMTESGGDPNAVSPDGAIGLMQIMLPTAREPGFGVENAFEIADRLGYVFNDTSDETLKRLLFLPDVNVEFGNQYLDAMLNQYSEVDDALRAYNAGKTNVDRFIASGRNLEALTDEAIQYPIKVTAAMQGFNPKDMNQMEMFRQAPETAVALMEDYPAPPVENRMFSPPPVRPDLPPTFFPSVMPQQRVAEGIETIQPAVPGVIKAQPKKMYQEPEGIATLTSSVRPRPRPLRFADGGAVDLNDFNFPPSREDRSQANFASYIGEPDKGPVIEGIESLANVEYEADMQNALSDNVSRLGFDPDIAFTILPGFDPKKIERMGDHYSPGPDRMGIDPYKGSSVPEVQAHEYRHRGLEKVLKHFKKYPFLYKEKYGQESFDFLTKMMEQKRIDLEDRIKGEGRSYPYSEFLHENFAEMFEQDYEAITGRYHQAEDGRVLVKGIHYGPGKEFETLDDWKEANPGVDLQLRITKSKNEDSRETPDVIKFRDYRVQRDRGELKEKVPKFEAVLQIQEAAGDLMKEIKEGKHKELFSN